MSKISIVTKGGDRGTTSLFTGERVSKSSLRPVTYGVVDELVSMLGLAYAYAKQSNILIPDIVTDTIQQIQEDLFDVGSELASNNESKLINRIDQKYLDYLESIVAKIEAIDDPDLIPTDFILPGGTTCGAALDVSRTIARRLERHIVLLQEEQEHDNDKLLAWSNRLSDVLWLLARVAEGSDPNNRIKARLRNNSN